MSILNYLKEQQSIQQLLSEARFDLVEPEQYKFYGLDSLETVPQKSGSCTVQCEGTYIFVFKENLFDMVIDTSITYPMIKNELGYVHYDVNGLKITPIYVNASNEQVELTDANIKSNPKVLEFMKSVQDQFKASVILDFHFDISEEDPSYDSGKAFTTLNSDSTSEVFRKLNNVSFILKDYITNFDAYVAKKIETKVFGPKYKMFVNAMTYYLTNIEFIGKEDYKGDTRRTKIYTKWFGDAGSSMGNMGVLNVKGTDFNIPYTDTQIA